MSTTTTTTTTTTSLSHSVILPKTINREKAFFGASQRYLQYKEDLDKKEKPVTFHFDSRKRDYIKFPLCSHFQIELPQKLENICTLELVGLEFTNTSNTVYNMENAQISWINENEASISYPVYTATVHLGTYTVSSITNEMVRAMNTIPRKLAINGQTTNHSWDCVITDVPTNAISFYNVLYKPLLADPFTTNADDPLITVYSPNHTFVAGDTVLFNGVSGDPGGVPNSFFVTTSFTVVNVVDSNQFTIGSTVVPYISTTSGGSTAQIGTATNYRFVTPPRWSQNTRSLLSILGFPKESCVLCRNIFTKTDLKALIESGTEVNVSSQASSLNSTSSYECTSINRIWAKFPVLLPLKMIGAENLGMTSNSTGSGASTITILTKNGDGSFRLRIDGVQKEAFQSYGSVTENETAKSKIGIYNQTIGMNSIQNNVLDTGSLYQSIDLSGISYCFLTSSQLQNSSTTANNVLSKIQLTTAPGFLDFNKIIATKAVWPEGKRQDFSYLELLLVDVDDKEIDLNGLNYSGTAIFTQQLPSKPSFLV